MLCAYTKCENACIANDPVSFCDHANNAVEHETEVLGILARWGLACPFGYWMEPAAEGSL